MAGFATGAVLPVSAIEALAAERQPYLYMLTLDGVPFMQDGLRDGEHGQQPRQVDHQR